MKNIFIIFFFFSLAAFSQETRVLVKGEILVPIGDDREGITVYNTSSNNGTITDKEGKFTLQMGVNDRVVFSALQYNDVIVKIDEGIVANQRLRLELVENLTVLDNVEVSPYDLSGDLSVDVGKTKKAKINPFEEVTIAEIENEYEISADAQTSVSNIAQDGFNFQNGLNFVNIFKAVFKKRDKYKIDETRISPNVDVSIRKMYDDTFFQEHLQLEMKDISKFIFYAEEQGLNATYFEKGKELDLISFLLEKRKTFNPKG